MHIFEKGAIFKNSKSGEEFNASVLVADIFELNTDFKAMMVIDVDAFNYESTNNDKTIEYMQKIRECDIFECDATAIGNNFRCKFADVLIDADYGNGSVLRIFVYIEDYEHHECKPISNHYNNMTEILSDLK